MQSGLRDSLLFKTQVRTCWVIRFLPRGFTPGRYISYPDDITYAKASAIKEMSGFLTFGAKDFLSSKGAKAKAMGAAHGILCRQ